MVIYNIEELFDNNLTDIDIKSIINTKIYNIINIQEIVLDKN